VADISRWEKLWNSGTWLPSYLLQRLSAPRYEGHVHLIVAMADHYEPSIAHPPQRFASRREQEERVEWWCRDYPKFVDPFRDSDGFPFRHTYFWPAEQYDPELLQRLVAHCHQGWGEIEIHLHHGVTAPDSSPHTRDTLMRFRDVLADKHGCLSVQDGSSCPQYAFVHGNFALANSARGRNCGVDDEIQILAETGCYADFTLPSAPNRSQVGKINAVYECQGPLTRRAAHRAGRNLRVGRKPDVFPLIIQGPLMLARNRSRRVYIENSAIAGRMDASMERLSWWRRANITVQGRPEWIFIKLHCHALDPNDREAMMGEPLRRFLQSVCEAAHAGNYGLHFVTAREMTNIALAACDGRTGNPGEFRDYRFHLLTAPTKAFLAGTSAALGLSRP
jgi:hypothetical protein